MRNFQPLADNAKSQPKKLGACTIVCYRHSPQSFPDGGSELAMESSLPGTTRRDVLRKAVFVTPVILTLPVLPSFARAGSNGDDDQDDQNNGNISGGSQNQRRGRRRHHWWFFTW